MNVVLWTGDFGDFARVNTSWPTRRKFPVEHLMAGLLELFLWVIAPPPMLEFFVLFV